MLQKIQGSPPQVRGKLQRNFFINAHAGITPAGAGKTPVGIVSDGRPEDHPRRCGENDSPAMLRVFYTGSPPQVRGKRKTRNFTQPRFRITPAGAGKTHFSSLQYQEWQDHPRRCGENTAKPKVAVDTEGSPPQVRGKLDMELFQAHYNRITPAGAGKTYFCHFTIHRQQDHPRRCGENPQ